MGSGNPKPHLLPDVAGTHLSIGLPPHCFAQELRKAGFHCGKAEEVFVAVFGYEQMYTAATVTYNGQGNIPGTGTVPKGAGMLIYQKDFKIRVKVVGQDHPWIPP